jgi:hypothetical protein
MVTFCMCGALRVASHWYIYRGKDGLYLAEIRTEERKNLATLLVRRASLTELADCCSCLYKHSVYPYANLSCCNDVF